MLIVDSRNMNNDHKIIYYAHSYLGQQGIIIIQCLLDYYAFICTYKNMCTVYDVQCTTYTVRRTYTDMRVTIYGILRI